MFFSKIFQKTITKATSTIGLTALLIIILSKVFCISALKRFAISYSLLDPNRCITIHQNEPHCVSLVVTA